MVKKTLIRNGSLSSQLGLSELGRFSWSELFSRCLSRHGDREVERFLSYGGPDTTPNVSESMTAWPRPWIFVRLLSAAIVGYLIIYWVLVTYKHAAIALLPALLVIGGFAVPLAVLMLFFELNTPKNVSITYLTKVGFLGGSVSFLLTFLLFDYFSILTLAYGASAAGFIEEVAKLLALLFIVRKTVSQRYPYLLNGLLLGATIGTGFSAFESAGYALREGMETNSFAALNLTLVMRGILSPFSHIVWSSIAAGAFWLAYKQNPSIVRALFSSRFFSLFIISSVLHFLWNLEIEMPLWIVIAKNILIGFLGWAVVMRLFRTGLSEVSTLNARA